MKKTLLVNGCSFTAGDDIAWDYQKHGSWNKEPNYFREEYMVNVRPKYNLAGQLSQLLDTTIVDFSRDGNSNSEISLKTIGYISQLPVEERKNLHVCIGWTERSRLCKWSINQNKFTTINVSMLEFFKKNRNIEILNLLYNEFYEWCMPQFLHSHDIDDLVNDITRVVALENYLKLEGITYTFWSTLSPPTTNDNIKILNTHTMIDLYKLSDNTSWINFEPGPVHPYHQISWTDAVLLKDRDNNFTPNIHPTLSAVNLLSKKIANHILSST
jgi:hypothetical protein